jgi:hypothetical protein
MGVFTYHPRSLTFHRDLYDISLMDGLVYLQWLDTTFMVRGVHNALVQVTGATLHVLATKRLLNSNIRF